jgi:branched-chain amino acid aminotransferase
VSIDPPDFEARPTVPSAPTSAPVPTTEPPPNRAVARLEPSGASDSVEPIACINGRWQSAAQAGLSLFDLGVVGGLAVSEMLRTFGHRPFAVAEHVQRLQESLERIGLSSPITPSEWAARVEELVRRNTDRLDRNDDVGVILFVTAGLNPTYVGRTAAQAAGLTWGLHTFPLQPSLYRHQYETGVTLEVSRVRALPSNIVDRRIKSRSRMHWRLADLEVQRRSPGSTALLLDDDGTLTETAAANLVLVLDGQVISPPPGQVLEGVSLNQVLKLCQQLRWSVVRRRVTLTDLAEATECWLTSTPPCVLPAVRCEDQPIGTGRPGPRYRQVLSAWSQLVGIDIAARMQRPDPR